MTAKQALLDYISGLTEEEAIEKLPFIIPPEPDFPPASDRVMAQFHKGIADLEAGRTRAHEEILRRFNLK